MNDREHLHDGEILLLVAHPSISVFVWHVLRAVVDSLAVSIVASLIVFIGFHFGAQMNPSPWVYGVLFIVSYIVVVWLKWKMWMHSAFRVTNERILIDYPKMFTTGERTVTWVRFQECTTKKRNIIDTLFGAKSLVIDFGTQGAEQHIVFPALTYAKDIKHYLDKVHSAVRANTVHEVHPFVFKPSGHRD